MTRQGFILIYTTILVGIIFVIVAVGFRSTLTESRAARDEQESLKALYVAETGIECVRFLQNYYEAFNTTTDYKSDYNCGVGDDFGAGGDPASGNETTAECVASTRQFPLQGFENGSCALVRVKTVPRTITSDDGTPITVCDVFVTSNGKNSCSATGNNLVERVRLESL